MGKTERENKKNERMKPRWGVIRSFILFLIRVYRRLLSPVMGGQCRFYPTCSAYSHLVFTYFPMHKAFYLSASRILRCNPYTEGGEDIPKGIDPNLLEEHIAYLQR